MSSAPSRARVRTTSSKNSQGSSYDVRARKHWLITVWQAYDADFGGELVGICRCYRCGDLLDFFIVTPDRIVPGCEGGTYRRTNIRPACLKCNEETGRLLGQARRAAKRALNGKSIRVPSVRRVR